MLRIYLCAFLSKTYIEEAKVCIKSLRKNGLFTGPIYLFTDMDVSLDNVEVIKIPCESIQLSACQKTRFFEHIQEYSPEDIFLQLDTDIVILQPLPSLDAIDHKIHVQGYPSRLQVSDSFAGFLTEDPHFTMQQAFNTGILLFRPSELVKKVFHETQELQKELLQKNYRNECWEQPVLCQKMIEHDMFTISLTNFVQEERMYGEITNWHIFNHFVACGINQE